MRAIGRLLLAQPHRFVQALSMITVGAVGGGAAPFIASPASHPKILARCVTAKISRVKTLRTKELSDYRVTGLHLVCN